MSFDLQVQFSGLLHYVPNADPSKRVRLCIVLPKIPNHYTVLSARGNSRLMLDGQAVESPGFDGKRVTFHFSRLGLTEPRRFDYDGPMLRGDVKGVVPFDLIAEDGVNENPAVVGDQATKAGVRAQILLGEGVFSLPPGEPAELDLPGTLTGQVTPIKLSQKVLMRVDDIDFAEIRVSSMNGNGPTEIYSIQPDDTDQAELLVGYLCPDPPAGTPDPTTDEDFKFHYRLLSRALGARGTIPEPVPIIRHLPQAPAGPTIQLHRKGRGIKIVTAGGCDCAGWGGKSLPLDLDKSLVNTPPRKPPFDLESIPLQSFSPG